MKAPYFENKPLAAPGFLSFRYRSQSGGFVMIGAKDEEDALREAQRSVPYPVQKENLERWNGSAYESVNTPPLNFSGGLMTRLRH